ncbi:hypothetical protein TNCV_449201 [Trichonephila clavipes]|nr:hypothetical protein TNCV_449201 [Trichonephila clavipes]
MATVYYVFDKSIFHELKSNAPLVHDPKFVAFLIQSLSRPLPEDCNVPYPRTATSLTRRLQRPLPEDCNVPYPKTATSLPEDCNVPYPKTATSLTRKL